MPGDTPCYFRMKSVPISNARAAKPGAGTPLSAIARFQQEEAGLRPAVLRQHDVPVLGAVLSQAYRHVAWFRENIKCLTLLVLIGVVIACVRGLCLWRTKTVSTRRRAGRRHPFAADAPPSNAAPGPRRPDRSGGDAGDRPVHEGSRRGSGRHSDLDLSPRLQSLAAAFLLLLALAVQWRVALQCLILLGGCWFLVQRQRLRFAAAEKLEESRADARLRLLAEGLRKTRIVRGYGMEDFEHEHFQHHLEKFRANVLHVLNMQHYLRLAVGFLVLACVAAVIYLVGSKVLQSRPTFRTSGFPPLC